MQLNHKTITAQLTVITVTHHSEKVIERCLRSLPGGARVIVIDNASSDRTREIVRATLPGVELICNPVGRGFGNAASQGLALADGEFVLLINPDAELQPDTVPLLLEAAQRYPEAAVLAPGLRSPSGQWEVSHDVDMFLRAAYPRRRTDPEPEGDICAGYISGAVILLRRTAMEQIGFFDPAIFLYYEDDDFCIRLRKHGWSLIRVAAASVNHIGGGSIRRSWDKHWEKFWHMSWSRLYVERKYHGGKAALQIGLRNVLRFGLKAPFYLLVDFRNKGLRDAARFCGSLSFLLGLKAQ